MEARSREHREAAWDGAGTADDSGWADWALRAGIFLGLGYLVYLNVSYDAFHPLIRLMEKHGWSRILARPSMLWALMGTLMLGFRTILWFRYRPHVAATREDAPSLTVIIPAYNEGAMVAKSVASVVAARYPGERLEILVVDDGSTDDTWGHIERVAGLYPEIVTKIRFRRNRGKRAALAEGIRRARGEVVVTIDSDSSCPSISSVRCNPPTGPYIAARGRFPRTGYPCFGKCSRTGRRRRSSV
jgi:hyaluronan synthase